MKKAFDQTVRDIKRGVNKKVLKVPSIEQKVLDATSNEPWGPHGTLLADIAQASRNYHEYQMIMSVIWKRVNDTGKNWRHVYKGLTVLEYLVANGSERIIDEIREHGYQISALAEFQYIDSSGRDQGSNVRKKSQGLVALVNDKERLQEVRQKAAANREKFRNTAGSGGMHRPGSYDDDRFEGRYGGRDEDRNGNGREREWGDDKYGKVGDSYGGRYSEDRYGRDGYRDDEYRGRSRSVDGENGPRSRSSDRDRERSYEDDGQYSSRGSNARTDDQSQDGRPIERKFSEQNLGAPPSYEDVAGDGRSPARSERDGETAAAFAPKSSSPPLSTNHQEPAASSRSPPPAAVAPPAAAVAPPAAAEHDGFDAFDPRGSFSAAAAAAPAAAPVPPASGGAEMDLFGSLSDVFSSNALALVPSMATTAEVDASPNSNPGQTFAAASSAPAAGFSQPFDDPFGDGPFRAVSSSDGFSAPPPSASPFTAQTAAPLPQPVVPTSEPDNNFGFSDNFDPNTDILADILPPSGPAPTLPLQTGFQAQPAQTSFHQTSHPSQQTGYAPQASQPFSQTGFPDQPNQTTFFQGGPPTSQPGFLPQGGQPMPQPGFQAQGGQPPQPSFQTQGGQPPQPGFQTQGGQGGQPMPQHGFPAQGGQGGFPGQMGSGSGFPGSNGPPEHTASFYGGYPSQGSSAPVTASSFYQHQQTQSQPALTGSTGALAIVSQEPAKDKFETKSTVWADTLNRGLVNLNISGSKTNPLSDIGIDFEAINRKEKRMEKPSSVPTTSNVSMGKAMGSGSGIGRVGAGALRPGPGPMAGGMGGLGSGYGGGGMGGPGVGYGVVNQPMNMGQGFPMQPGPGGYPMGPAVPGSYNPMMGRGGGYGQQPPPYGGYR